MPPHITITYTGPCLQVQKPEQGRVQGNTRGGHTWSALWSVPYCQLAGPESWGGVHAAEASAGASGPPRCGG
jgi:hypothetical protein